MVLPTLNNIYGVPELVTEYFAGEKVVKSMHSMVFHNSLQIRLESVCAATTCAQPD